eukprot:symbB.v1.2.010948.t1/scaffold724.1/size168915/6
MVMATMTLDWAEKYGQHGTDHLAQVWATMLESGGLTAKTFAVDPGQILFATYRPKEAYDIKEFVLSQPDVDFFEENQQRSFPGKRVKPLVSDALRKQRLQFSR